MSQQPILQPLLHPTPHHSEATSGSDSFFDFITIFKMLFYLVFIVKIIELSFLRRKKYSLKERIYRKFLFAHQELLRHFTEQDKSMMEMTLSNTMKNASIEYDPKNSKIRKPNKRVNFLTEKNNYYEPKNWREEESKIKKDGAESTMVSSSFEEKKLDDEFGEREDLLGLNQKEDQLLPLQSKIAEPSGGINRENFGSGLRDFANKSEEEQ